jgi:hypothetical protein
MSSYVMNRGNPFPCQVTVSKNGVAGIDAGGKVLVSVKRSLGDADGSVWLGDSGVRGGVVITSYGAGTAVWTMPASATAGFETAFVSLNYAVKYIDGAGNPWDIESGLLVVKPTGISPSTV